jgi:hypothetical protein
MESYRNMSRPGLTAAANCRAAAGETRFLHKTTTDINVLKRHIIRVLASDLKDLLLWTEEHIKNAASVV